MQLHIINCKTSIVLDISVPILHARNIVASGATMLRMVAVAYGKVFGIPLMGRALALSRLCYVPWWFRTAATQK